jgi:hypothetical protein
MENFRNQKSPETVSVVICFQFSIFAEDKTSIRRPEVVLSADL